jgi:hypothetical protein
MLMQAHKTLAKEIQNGVQNKVFFRKKRSDMVLRQIKFV